MARVTLQLPEVVEKWDDPEVEGYFRESHRKSTPAIYKLQLLANSEVALKSWCRFWWATFRRGTVEHTLMERVRIRTASLVSCNFCGRQRSQIAANDGLREEHYLQLRESEVENLTPREQAVIDFVTQITLNPVDMDPAYFTDLGRYFTPAEIVEIAIFTVWQSNGLRAIVSWDAEEYFTAEDVPLSYADGPSLFTRGGADVPLAVVAGYPIPDVVVPLPRPNAPLGAQKEAAIAASWARWGTPTPHWQRFLSAAPHVLWGWSEFHRLQSDEGEVPQRIQKLTEALLAILIDHPEWTAGMFDGSAVDGLSAKDHQALRQGAANGDFSAFDAKTAAALSYTYRLEIDYLDIDDAYFAEISKHLTTGEIMEISNYAGMHMGCIRLDRFLTKNGINW